MKHKLLSLLALSAMFVSASAQTEWADPVAPTHPAPPAPPIEYSGTWATPEVGGKYYIYNVGSGLFLGGGQTWGTRGIVLCDSVVLVDQDAVKINNVSGNTTANYVFPMELVAGVNEDQFNINVLNNSKATGGSGHFVGEDGAQAWIDGDAGRNANFGAWTITPYQNGYMIQNVNASTVKYVDEETGDVTRAFGVDGYNIAAAAGWATTWTDLWIVKPEGNNTYPWIVWQFVDAEQNGEAVRAYANQYKQALESDEYKAIIATYESDMEAYNAKVEGYKAKVNLKAALIEGEQAGIDVTAQAAVYNNADATLEEVNLAIAAIKAAIARAKWDFSAASEENPLDITDQVIENPTFDTDISGWTITVQGQNLQRQARTDGSIDPSKNWVQITNFIEAWISNSTHLGDGTISQTVYGLPKGKYVLECDAMATLQGQPEDSVRGAYIFIEGSDHETRSDIKSPDTQPKHWSVTFINGESDYLTFGLKVENTTANWISADNFQLTFYGETEESLALATLRVALSKANETVIDDVYAEASAKDVFAAAISKAEEDINAAAGDEAYEADYTAIQEATTVLNASIAVYETLNALINRATSTSEEIADQWSELADEIDAWIEETLTPAYEDGTYSAEDITAAQEQLPKMIRDFIATPGKVQPGDKVTILIENAGFTNGLTGWTIANRNGGNFGTKFDGIEYPEIECWHGTFDVYQVIANMPRGAYKLKVQGFCRNDDASQESTVELYAGMVTTRFMGINAEYSMEPFTEEATNGRYKDQETTNDGGDVCYVPSGMASAQQFFMRENPATGMPFYTNIIDVILPEDGDLQIGVRCHDTHSWVLWSNFELEYAGNDASLYENTIRDLVDQLVALPEVDEPFITARAAQLIDELPAKAETAINSADADECIAMVQELNDAIEYIKAGNAAGTALINEASLYNDYLINAVVSSYNDFLDLVNNISDYAADATVVEDNDQIAALSAQLKTEWGKYVMYDIEATKDDPQDVSAVILNNNYANELTTGEVNASYWTNEEGTPGFQNFAEIEFYNKNFNHYQKLEGLKAGFYEVSVAGFYRAGLPANYTDSLATVNNAVVFATSSIGTATVGLNNAVTGAQEETLGGGTSEIQGLTEGNGLIPNNMEAAYAWISAELYPNSLIIEVGEDGILTIGVKKSEHIEGDWTIFSNWALCYYGAGEENRPDAVVGISNSAKVGIQQIVNINGIQQNGLRRGLNIIRMTDGSVRKVIVK
ncbi:MAG: hypothetical protein J5486_00760 [Bacteroidaceae bacterium]|nr:hypothetical protein [Bacteroidaceae bacterium]